MARTSRGVSLGTRTAPARVVPRWEGGYQQQPIPYLQVELPRHLARQHDSPALQVEPAGHDAEVAAQAGVAAVQVSGNRPHRHHLPPRAGSGECHALALAGGAGNGAEVPLEARGEVVQQPPPQVGIGFQPGRQSHLQVVAAHFQKPARDSRE